MTRLLLGQYIYVCPTHPRVAELRTRGQERPGWLWFEDEDPVCIIISVLLHYFRWVERYHDLEKL